MSRALTGVTAARRTCWGWPLVLLVAAACGYEPLYPSGGGEPLAVVAPARLAPDAAAADELAAGARAALGRAGRLRPGNACPRLVLELLRIDDTSEGISAAAGTPLARGTGVSVVARGFIERTAGGGPEHDSGDLRATEVVSTESDGRLEALRHGDAVRAAARRLGIRLGRFALGEPIAPDEGI